MPPTSPLRWPSEAERLARRVNDRGPLPGWDETLLDPDDVDDPDLVGLMLQALANLQVSIDLRWSASKASWTLGVRPCRHRMPLAGPSLPRLLLQAWLIVLDEQ